MAHRSQPPYVMNVLDVSASRTAGVTYTNTTGRTLHVAVTCRLDYIPPSTMCWVNGLINGVFQYRTGILYGDAALHMYKILTMTVPVGATYRVSFALDGASAASVLWWVESY